MGVDLSDIGEELTLFWAETRYLVADYWVETEIVQLWGGDKEAVQRQRMAFVRCWRLLARSPRNPTPEAGTGLPKA
jgi:hypothetical protein